MRIIGGLARTIAWVVVAAALALGGAGLVGQLSHPPGGPSRAELTYAADAKLRSGLDATTDSLRALGAQVDQLAADARAALEAVGGADATTIRAALARGERTATKIVGSVEAVRADVQNLPGDSPTAAIEYSNDLLARRASTFAALDAAEDLAQRWKAVTDRSSRAAELTIALNEHETTVAAAATEGRAAQYQQAIATLNHALDLLNQAQVLRAELLTSADQTVLDEWVARHRKYDEALMTLYQTLLSTAGVVTHDVEVAYHEENVARSELPTDSRALIVIVAEIARGGLNQAVVAIEDARGQISEALQELTLS
jgi:hypothetical protein